MFGSTFEFMVPALALCPKGARSALTDSGIIDVGNGGLPIQEYRF